MNKLELYRIKAKQLQAAKRKQVLADAVSTIESFSK